MSEAVHYWINRDKAESESPLFACGTTTPAPACTDIPDVVTCPDCLSIFLGGEASDNVNSPRHYRWLPVEAIEITEHFNFCMGNALKYILRADHKGRPEEDIAKAIWYLQRELSNRKRDAT